MSELDRLIAEQAADDTDFVDQEILEVFIEEGARGYDDEPQRVVAETGLDTFTGELER